MTANTAILLCGFLCAVWTLLFLFTAIYIMSARFSKSIRLWLKEKSTHPSVLKDIEWQFSDFMRNRIGNEMPVLKMFMDEALIDELRIYFMKEVESYIPHLGQKLLPAETELSKMVRNHLIKSSVPLIIALPSIQILTTLLICYLA